MKLERLLFTLCAAIALTVAANSGALAQVSKNGAIKIEEAWVRESPIGGNSGGGYMKITNTGKEADRLLSAESPAAASIELKQMSYVGETLQTRTVPNGIEIPAGESIQLRWEAYHLLFQDLKKPFARDLRYEATLNFEKAGAIKVEFGVRPRVYW